MENFLDGIKALSFVDVLYAAITALVITSLILRFKRIKQIITSKEELSMEYKGIDIASVMNKCKSMFPIETVYFHGRTYTRGMIVRITTRQKKVIEGELVGCNKLNILCILTKQHVIAHELDRIEEITDVNAKAE